MYTASLKYSENYKAQPYQYASPSKKILKAKEKPFPPCIHFGFNDHRHDDCRNYPECEIYRSYDHFTSGRNHVIHVRGGVLAESSHSSESLIEDDPSWQYQIDSDISYYIIPHGRSLTELTQEKHVPRVIATNEQDNPQTENAEGMLTRSIAAKHTAASASEYLFADFLFEIEPKKVSEALKHPGWVNVMQEELNQFYRNKEERIDYDETFAPVARMEAIRIFLAFATYMNFTVFQMDVKSAFLNGKLKEEVYVKQPPGFESSEFPNYVFKLDKALYGLKQAPRACSSVKTPTVSSNNLRHDLAGLSSNEAEYVAAAGCCSNILWIKSQLNDYDIHYKMVPIFCDNTSAIAISNNPVLHSRNKNINIRYLFIRDHILKGDIELNFIPTEYQLADSITKPLDEPTFTRLKAKLGMLNID
ncbi:retrovirus-related pol polyprotein from transposon TNT 1-94 [Tanacetum coccineum]|uniref:Retrovirus-related pol polyprotein from transposon TNT 1-94 n=1 Tax=Tanacetum coccineum TaxID=301880 RepID=A0ABQ5FBS1_9ASTR